MNQSNIREELSLLELSNRIKGVIKKEFPEFYWVRAEMSDVRLNVSGHCYLEFIEKRRKIKSNIGKSARHHLGAYDADHQALF